MCVVYATVSAGTETKEGLRASFMRRRGWNGVCFEDPLHGGAANPGEVQQVC